MSNPPGPDEDATPAAQDTEEAQQSTEAASAEQTTEVIRTGDPEPEFESAEPTVALPGAEEQDAERRYSAPSGFDVRSTEVIRTSHEPETEVMSRPEDSSDKIAAAAVSNPRPAAPQAIPPRDPVRRHRSWGLVLALILIIAALAAVAVLGTIWFTRKRSAGMSNEEQVRQTIQDFDTAVQRGDLPMLRSITCGTTRDSYVNYPDDEWKITYPKVAAAKQYPVVASIDQVVVNDDQHAEANVTAFVAYQPQVRSTRSFDLQFVDGRWKICDGPMNIPR